MCYFADASADFGVQNDNHESLLLLPEDERVETSLAPYLFPPFSRSPFAPCSPLSLSFILSPFAPLAPIPSLRRPNFAPLLRRPLSVTRTRVGQAPLARRQPQQLPLLRPLRRSPGPPRRGRRGLASPQEDHAAARRFGEGGG